MDVYPFYIFLIVLLSYPPFLLHAPLPFFRLYCAKKKQKEKSKHSTTQGHQDSPSRQRLNQKQLRAALLWCVDFTAGPHRAARGIHPPRASAPTFSWHTGKTLEAANTDPRELCSSLQPAALTDRWAGAWFVASSRGCSFPVSAPSCYTQRGASRMTSFSVRSRSMWPVAFVSFPSSSALHFSSFLLHFLSIVNILGGRRKSNWFMKQLIEVIEKQFIEKSWGRKCY